MTETVETPPSERYKQPMDLAIACGRSLQSGQTGFVHYCYKSYDEEPSDTIPVSENLLFALSLLKTRMADSIAEAKSIIERILHFQNRQGGDSHGNFPIYLHDYPACRDPLLSAHLLPTFYWIHRDFRKVMGNDLGPRLDEATELLLSYSLKAVQKGAPYPLALKIAAAAKAFGTLWERKSLEQQGETDLHKLRAQGVVPSWYAPAHLGDMLIALQMAEPLISKGAWKPLWDHLNNTWHRKACTYVGPAYDERQRHHEPQCTVYDLFMGHFSGTYSYRSFFIHPFQLQGALIQTTDERLPELMYPMIHASDCAGDRFVIYQTEDYGYSIMQHRTPQNPSQEYRVHPFHAVWGARNRTHTLVCQGGSASEIDFEILPDGRVEMQFTLPAMEVTGKDGPHEVSFYIDMQDGVEKMVGGKKATTFQVEDTVTLNSDGMEFVFSFEQTDDNAQQPNKFFGHIMPGNRPAQMNLKGANRFKAFDYQVFLRAVERSSPCRILVRMSLKKVGGLWT